MRIDGADIADRMAREQGHDLTLEVDPVQVQVKVDGYLHARGQQIAQDMDLGPVGDDDLRELGRLDAIAQYPTLPPDIATHLAMVVAERSHNPYKDKYSCFGCSLGTHPHWPCTKDQDPDPGMDQVQTPPETDLSPKPDILDMGSETRLTGSKAGRRGVSSRKIAVQNAKNVRPEIRDHPDDDWS